MQRARNKLRLLFALLVWIPLAASPQSQDRGGDVPVALSASDSLRSFSPEELLRYREFYRREIQRLQDEIRQLRDQGIRNGEDFLSRHPESKVVDKVLFRLAEFYYYKAQEDFQRRMEEYERLVALHDSGKVAELPPEPRKDYRRVLELYRTLVEQFPQSKYVDDALYNTGFLMEEEGRQSEALSIYQKLIDQFPQSPYVPEALMRIAEYYFNPPVNQIEKAIEIYQRLLAFHETPRYDEALYRLGWCYFRLGDYPRAIAYFTLLADDINLAKRHDRANKISNPALQEEGIEYIGISFLDFGGPVSAANFLREIGDRDYGFTILKKIGDVYFDEKEEYANAIEAYRVLLSLYPHHPQAPEIQNRIVLAHRKLQDEELASQERLRLFEQYALDGAWWQKNQGNPEALRTAERLARNALADNLQFLLSRASETGHTDVYREYVRQAGIFLKHFPSDTLAAQVHWNLALILDTKLGERQEAFRQYIALSNTYLGSPYQKMAAENAVAVAQEIVKSESDSTGRSGPTLSPPEQRLVEAYDNFIRLFPDEEKTGLMLASAGALFYNHRQFDQALRYFKTLVLRFPNSEHLEKARLAILESYFGKKDYRSTELAAKKILSDTRDEELRGKARRRLAEAIFLTADSLARQGSHSAAGQEFARVVAEVPEIEFADLALFKAATEFDLARDYAAAVPLYEKLVDSYRGSRYLLDAMNNLALDYGELQRFTEAASTYEKLADLHPDSSRAQDALYNASAFYVRAEDWRSAIRVNRRFVDRFPRAREADDLFFDIASYYLKLGELASANQIYAEYAQRFPNSPRVVESYFRRGEYYRQQGDLVQARLEYEKAVDQATRLRASGLDGNDYYHAEALFALAELKYDEYARIAFRLPEEELRQSKKRKADLLKELVGMYTRVAQLGTPRLYPSTFRIAQAYEDFADTWAGQEVAEADPTRRAVKLKAIDEEAAQLYERAASAYLEAVSVLERVAAEYAATHGDSSGGRGSRVTPPDTTLQAAQRWIQLAKLKATHVVYKIAEVSFEAARRLLSAPVPPDLGPLAELEYWNQLYSKAVAPIVERTLTHHRRNLALAQQFGTQTEWVERSRRRLAEIALLIPIGYRNLADSAVARYCRTVGTYAELLGRADSADHVEEAAYEMAGQVGHLLDYTKAFARTAVERANVALAMLDTLDTTATLAGGYADEFHQAWARFGLKCDSLARVAQRWKEQALILQKRTNSYLWEDASLTFEDAQFSLEDASVLTLEAAFRIAESRHLRSPWASSIILTLLLKDAARYAPMLGLSLVNEAASADSSWEVSLTDSLTGELAFASGTLEAVDSLQVGHRTLPLLAACLSAVPGPRNDSLPRAQWRITGSLHIPGLPAQGQVRIFCGSTYDLFVNGQYLAHVQGNGPTAGSWHVHKLTEFLSQGENRLEIRLPAGTDSLSSPFGVLAEFSYVADWDNQKHRLGLAEEDPVLAGQLYFRKNLIPDYLLSGGKTHGERLAGGRLDANPDVTDGGEGPQPDKQARETRPATGRGKGNGSWDDIH